METMNICTKHTGPRIYGYTDTCMNQILVVGLFAGISTQQAWKTASNYWMEQRPKEREKTNNNKKTHKNNSVDLSKNAK